MRIFLAYKFDHHIEKEDIHRKMAKIKHHYYTSSKVNESQSILDNTGVCIWSEENTSMKWPVHYENRDFHIYTLTPPPNIYHYANKNADVPMIDIENNSNLLRGLSAPFLFSVINKHTEEIKIYIDSMGFS